MRSPHGWLLVPVMLLACGGSEPKTSSSGGSESSAAGPKQESSLRQQMHEHFVHLSSAQSAVIEGRLDAAKSATASVWPSARPSELPPKWSPYIGSLKAGVELMGGATELETAAMAVSAIGRACGDCHRAFGIATIGEAEQSSAPPPESLGDYMRLHQWAADRLWEGLVGPSDAAWTSGAQALLRERLDPAKIPEEILVKPGMKQMVEQVHTFAEAAARPGLEGPEKQRLYGEFLGGCARCHRTFLEGVD